MGQRENGVGESVPAASGDVNVHLGQQRLLLARPLRPLEPVQDPIDLTAQVRLRAHQAIRHLLAWNDRSGQFVRSLCPSSGPFFPSLCETFDFSVANRDHDFPALWYT